MPSLAVQSLGPPPYEDCREKILGSMYHQRIPRSNHKQEAPLGSPSKIVMICLSLTLGPYPCPGSIDTPGALRAPRLLDEIFFNFEKFLKDIFDEGVHDGRNLGGYADVQMYPL